MAVVSKEEYQNAVYTRSLSIKSSWILTSDLRLDADFYAKEKELARRILDDKRFTSKPLKSLVRRELFSGYRFKRIYTTDKTLGMPYLSATETLTFRPVSNRYLSKSKTENFDDLLVSSGWILMTCSGVIGRLVIVDDKLAKFILTHDLIRIIPSEDRIPLGYLYAFLSTWIAQSIMTRDQYGLAINHVEPHQIQDLPIPLLDERIMRLIDKKIRAAYRLRQEGNTQLDTAEALFYKTTQLPEEISDPLKDKKSFSIKSSTLNMRFDGSFHNPLMVETLARLNHSKLRLVKIKDICKTVVAGRFKRIYVERQYGVPFLQGSDLPMIRPFNLKYLSTKMTANLQNWIIREGWSLVTCSGTIGRVGLSTPITDGWAASQHIMRIIPKTEPDVKVPYKIDAAYITTYLDTPYGHNQLVAKTYGGVVDEINDEDAGEVYVPILEDKSVHDKISRLTRQAYANKDLASIIEEETIHLLESLLEGTLMVTDSETLEESLEETIQLKSSQAATAIVNEGINDIKEYGTISFEEVKKKYGID